MPAPNKHKSQAALEYMIVLGLALLILTPIALKGMESTSNFNRDINLLRARDALAHISDAAKVVYFQGPQSAMTIRVVFPDNIIISNVSGNEIYFRMGVGETTTDVVEQFDFNVIGDVSGGPGERTIYIEALDYAVNITRIR